MSFCLMYQFENNGDLEPFLFEDTDTSFCNVSFDLFETIAKERGLPSSIDLPVEYKECFYDWSILDDYINGLSNAVPLLNEKHRRQIMRAKSFLHIEAMLGEYGAIIPTYYNEEGDEINLYEHQYLISYKLLEAIIRDSPREFVEFVITRKYKNIDPQQSPPIHLPLEPLVLQ